MLLADMHGEINLFFFTKALYVIMWRDAKLKIHMLTAAWSVRNCHKHYCFFQWLLTNEAKTQWNYREGPPTIIPIATPSSPPVPH